MIDRDRRVHERFEALGNLTELEWWDGSRTGSIPARLLNVSLGGALVRTAQPIPGDSTLWIRLEEPVPTDWIGARVVRRVDDHEAALAFLDCCPFDFLQTATLGIALDNVL